LREGLAAVGIDDEPRVHDVTVPFEPVGKSVMATFAESLGGLPRVLLADTDPESGPEPIERPDSPELLPHAPGGSAGRYLLFGEIARGGMGAVIRARDPDLGRDLALKVLLERHRNNPELIKRFLEEAQIGGQLQHPGIAPVHELGTFGDNRPFFAMKLVKGRTLAALLAGRKDPADELAKYLRMFEHVAQTVAYAHSRRVIHRDLKPSNVMVGSFGEVQVMDWGLAKVLQRGGLADEPSCRSAEESIIETGRSGSGADASRAGSIFGTPAYMSREQALGDIDSLDERCDVFALGSILCEILTGLPAYTGDSLNAILARARNAELGETFARLEASGADIELRVLARRCMAVELEGRARNASVVADAVTAHLAGVQERLRRAQLAKVAAQGRARLTVALAASMLIFAISFGGTWAWLRSQTVARQARTGREVDVALQEATTLWGEARTAVVGDLAPWNDALGAAKRASALLARGEGDAEITRRVTTTLSGLTSERDHAQAKAEAMARDRRLIERIGEISTRIGDRLDRRQTEADYSAAFRDAGLEVDSRSPEVVAAQIASRPGAVELAAGLDAWSFERRMMDPPDFDGARRLNKVANLADPESSRQAIRDAVLQEDLGAIKRLAASIDPTTYPVWSVQRLAHALVVHGDPDAAILLLQPLQRLHPGDFWVNFELAIAYLERQSPQPAEGIRYFTAMVALRPETGFGHRCLGAALEAAFRLEEAIAEYKEAIRLQPEFDQVRHALVTLLNRVGRSKEAATETESLIRCRRDAVERDPASASARIALVRVLRHVDRLDDALIAARETVRRFPTDGFVHQTLAWVLLARQEWDQAIAEYDEAMRLDQAANPDARFERGLAYQGKGRWADAIADFRLASRINPANRWIVINLVGSLVNAERWDEALQTASESAARRPSDGGIRQNYAWVLLKRKDWDAAIAAYREAITLAGADPAVAHHEIGLALEGKGDEDAAIAAYREAIRINPDFAEAYLRLGSLYRLKGDHVRALASYRKGREVGTKDPNSNGPSAVLVTQAERELAMAGRVPALLNGDEAPKDMSERLCLAQFCYDTKRYAAAARFWADAFANDAKLAEDQSSSHRYNAACAAALASFRMGRDALSLTDSERARLRQRALNWLRADLTASKTLLETDPQRSAERKRVLRHWRSDPDLESVRDHAHLEKLTEPERNDWRTLWADVDTALHRR
jgi:serine/threonine-protein kinase